MTNTQPTSWEVSAVQSNRALSGHYFEVDVTQKLMESNITPMKFLKGSGFERVELSETGLSFDVDMAVKGGKDEFGINRVHMIEIKKSVSDSTICKIYCQYQAYFNKFISEENTNWTFTVVVEEMTKVNERYLSRLSKLPNFRYTSIKDMMELDWS